MTAQGTEAQGVLGQRYWKLTVAVILAVSIVAFEQMALVTIAPVIARDLDGVQLYAWIFSAFLLAQIVGAVAAGQETDRRGIAKPFIASLAIIGAGLLIGAISSNMATLVLGRAIQGLGGGALVTCVYATINIAYPDALRPRMLAAFSSAFVLPALIGPAMSGFVAEQVGWRAIFYGFLPFLALVGYLALPAFGRPVSAADSAGREATRLNRLPGGVFLASGTALLLVGLQVAAGEDLSPGGIDAPAALLGLPLAGMGALMVVPALRSILPSGTFIMRPGLPATVASKGIFTAAYFYTEVHMVLALTQLADYAATTAGLVVSAGAVSWPTATWIQERLDKRNEGRGRRSRVLAGAVLMTIGIGAVATPILLWQVPNLALALGGWVISGLGMGLANPASTAIAFAHAPSGKEGAVSSLVLLAELFGPAASIGVGGALVTLGGALGSGFGFGVALAFGLSLALAAFCLTSAYRLPHDGPAQSNPEK